MPTFDGLKLAVQFYDNHGQLKMVSEKSGVSVERLRKWIDGGDLSQGDRDLLGAAANSEVHEQVVVS